jgi:hypothetical protein
LRSLAHRDSHDAPCRIQGRATLETTFTACTGVLVFVALLAGLVIPSPAAAESFVGGCATAAALLYYAAPLSSAWEVVRSRSAASLSLPLCLASLTNAALWSVYGAAVRDPAILVPNVPGIACGLLQLALIARFGARLAPAGAAKDAAAAAGTAAAPGGYDALDEEGGSGREGGRVGERTLSPRRPSSGHE